MKRPIPVPKESSRTPHFWLWIYQIFLVLFGLAYLSLRLIRGRLLPGFKERLALYGRMLRQEMRRLNHPIWIHLVSVGEVLAAQPLVEELRRRFPERNWVITTVTFTGRSLAKRLVREGRDLLLYLPWDLTPVVRRAAQTLQPCLFLSFETELWPILFHELGRSGIPIAVVNGRISPSAYPRYLWIRPWMEKVLDPVSLFLTQSPQDARRYAAIGASKDRITVTGNLKWDLRGTAANGLPPEQARQILGLSPQSVLWTAGSTHSGEDAPILQAYLLLKREFPQLRLLVAPRHPERVAEVEQQARRLGLNAVRRTASEKAGDAVIVLDTLGELTHFYQASDLVFVGGSLVPHGGHNLVEPAFFRRPILAGPHLFNFSTIAEQLAQAGALVVVQSPKELEEAVRRLLRDSGTARQMGSRAWQVVEAHRGATDRTADLIDLRWGGVLIRA